MSKSQEDCWGHFVLPRLQVFSWHVHNHAEVSLASYIIDVCLTTLAASAGLHGAREQNAFSRSSGG